MMITKRPILSLLILVATMVGLTRPSPALGERAPRSRRSVPPAFQVPITNSAGLAHFHKALRRLEAGASRRVRVMHFGDSHVAADVWTGHVRRGLQSRFGDGGPGYILPRGHGSFHRGPVSVKAGRAWKTRRHGFAKAFGPVDGLWGLAGVAIEGRGRGAWLEAHLPQKYRGGHFEVHVLGRELAGRVTVTVPGKGAQPVVAGPAPGGFVCRRWPLAPGRQKVRIQAQGQTPVRLLGIVLEQDTPGVVYDVLGINGHRLSAFSVWNEPLLAAQLDRRRPDLVVLSYGGNEALARPENLPLPQYEAELNRALDVVHRLTPGASHLLVGPTSLCPHQRRLDDVAEIMARTARRRGYSFWDMRQITGGPGSLCRWRQSHPGWAAPDGVHFRRRGYEHMGRLFLQALLGDYE